MHSLVKKWKPELKDVQQNFTGLSLLTQNLFHARRPSWAQDHKPVCPGDFMHEGKRRMRGDAGEIVCGVLGKCDDRMFNKMVDSKESWSKIWFQPIALKSGVNLELCSHCEN